MAWKDGLCESGLYKFDAGEVNLGKIESGSRYAGIYKLRLYKSANNGYLLPLYIDSLLLHYHDFPFSHTAMTPS